MDAERLYNVARWGEGYFDVGPGGRLRVRPRRGEGPALELAEVAAAARAAGLGWPVLLRFTDILRDRVAALVAAFDRARAGDGYRGAYTAVYPIKVNQQRSVVEAIVGADAGRVGLEAGSKPELMAVLALAPPGGVIVCNGYKDREYVELALAGRALGHRLYLVLEKASEVPRVIEAARRLGVEPLLGVRVRLASIGAGKWQNTGGEKSKFGLAARELPGVVEALRGAGLLGGLRMLHFHLGSQVANIRDIQRGVREAARFYAELRRLGAPLDTVDVGGGLGVDYEGTRSRSFCSMNYTLDEYAFNIVHTLWEVCAETGLPHPDILSESGRALTAHHAVLVTNVTDVEPAPDGGAPAPPPADAPHVLRDLWQAWERFAERSPLEIYHEAAHWLAEAQSMFDHGLLDLAARARAEALYHALCRRVQRALDPQVRAHREALDELNEKLADKYFCNLSIFQSMPDVWAIDQIFPIVPLARLDEPPARRAVVVDLTCDSDGRIDWYVGRDGVETTLPLHAPRPGEDYLLGFFLVGAYQEILGDMHNLFGDTDSANVVLEGEGWRLEEPLRGDTVDRLLRYVHFDPERLRAAYAAKLEAAGLGPARAEAVRRILEAGLEGYTYLED